MSSDIPPRPVWEEDQIITPDDLLGLRVGFVELARQSSTCCNECRLQAVTSIGVIDSLSNWIMAGKPAYLKSQFNEETGRFDEAE